MNMRQGERSNGEGVADAVDCSPISIAILGAGLKAVITGCAPTAGAALLTADDLERIAREAGVCIGCDATGAKLVMQALAEGRDPTGIVLARGVPPEEPADACLEPLGDLACPVFPGDVFARLRPATPGQPGLCVDGRKIPAPVGLGESVTVICEGDGVQYDPGSGLITATVYGLAAIDGCRVSVAPLIAIAPDGLRVFATIHARDYKGDPIVSGRFGEAFRRLGVCVPPDALAIKQAAFLAQEEGPQTDVIVGAAEPPVDGEDGRFEPLFATNLAAGRLVDETGRMDFFERGVVRTAKEGDLLGRIIPPTPGAPGRTVTGATLPAKAGRPITITAKEGVSVSPDGLEFHASTSGAVVWSKNAISVTEILTVEGDVNFSVGNIRMEKGSVVITGSVLNGFTIVSPGNVMVGATVGNVRIETEGDVTVRGGVMMGKGGKITAGGTIAAKFAMNAALEAQGNVQIVNEINDCRIVAGDMVVATGAKGIILGGSITCGGGVEAAEIGSELGVVTTISIGHQLKLSEELLEERREIRLKLKKIETVIGAGSPADILGRTPPAKRQALLELVGARSEMSARLREIDAKIADVQVATRQAMRSMVKARRVIHPGVVICIAGLTMRVTKPLNYSRVYYDQGANALIVAPYA